MLALSEPQGTSAWSVGRCLISGCLIRPINYIPNAQLRRESPDKSVKGNHIFSDCCKMGRNLTGKPRTSAVLTDLHQTLLNLVLQRKYHVDVKVLQSLTS